MILSCDLMLRLAYCALFLCEGHFNAYGMRQDENIKRPISGSYNVLGSEGSRVLFLVYVCFSARRGDVATLRLA